MTRAYPATWPGTAVIKSVHNAFNWRPASHEDCSATAESDYTLRTAAYNAWRAARRAAPDTTPDWPQWRDERAGKPARPRGRPRKAEPGGFKANNGTVAGGLSKKSAHIIAHKPNTFTIVGSRHGGAYSKASPKAVPAHLALPAGAKVGRARA